MENLEKPANPMDYKLHCFPALQDGPMGDPAGHDAACQRFRPLFQPVADPANVRPEDKDDGGHTAGGASEASEVVRRKRFQEGVVAGSNDACNLVRQELEPAIKKFVDEFKKYEDSFTHLTRQCVDHLAALALSMAGKVMGAPTQLEADYNAQVSLNLQRCMDENYRLKLQLNPHDLKILCALAGPHGIKRDNPAIQIVEDPNTLLGETCSKLPEPSIEELSNWFR